MRQRKSHKAELDREQLLRIYYFMKLGRSVEERLESLYRQGRFPSAIYPGRGQEAAYVGSAFALRPGDVMAPTHRDMIAMLPRGIEIKSVFAQHFAKATSPTKGRGEATYLGDLGLGVLTTVSMLPDFYPVSAGVALAFKYRGEKRVALAYCGEGATSRGDWHEALNFAAVLNLPTVFFVINNQFAYSTPTAKEMKIANVADRAVAYGIPGQTVDGNDVLEVYEATKKAVERAVSGLGPTLLEAKTMRMRGHAGHDPFDYVPKKLMAEWEKKDPIKKYVDYLTKNAGVAKSELAGVDERIAAEVEDAVSFAEESPMPEPSEVVTGVYR